jgi:uncharacterized membrane protein YfcA
MSAQIFLLLLGAGVAAGLSGSIAGLASLFSYPALLVAGLSATAANVTNTVSLAVSSFGSVAGSRPELAGQYSVIRRFALVALAGGATGAGLLLLTPPGVFERIVPFLIGCGSGVVLLQPRLHFPAAQRRRTRPIVVTGLFGVSVYSGYFGAAAGVLTLALLLAALPETLLRLNALKNVLMGLSNMIAALGFTFLGPVSWAFALPLAIGLLIGGFIGPSVARRLPATVLRVTVAVAGLGLAVKLGFDAW